MKPLAAMICLICLLGCAPTPPGHQPINADTPISFAMWRSQNSDALTRKEWSLFNQTLDEFKLHIMQEGKASGSEAVDAVLRAKIDGMKLRDLLLAGQQLRLKRLRADKVILEESFDYNSKLKLKPGDEEKARALAEKVRIQSERLTDLRQTVAEAEADLQQLELKFR